MDEDIRPEWTRPIIGAAMEVHKVLGPGLLESAYQACLAHELTLRGIEFVREVPLSLNYKGIALECGYRLDFLVQGRVVVEVKAVEATRGVHIAQLMTYLYLSETLVGLIINFNSSLLYEGVTRLVNNRVLRGL